MTIDRDRAAQVIGALRFLSGAAFVADPIRTNRIWGQHDDPGPTARLLMRSMGYRDALIGALLFSVGSRGADSRGWFLASAGADAADLIGALSVRADLPSKERATGIVGAAVGVAVGIWGALRAQRGQARTASRS